MNSLHHKIGLHFLLLLVAVPTIYAFTIQIEQVSFRERMKEHLEKETLATISLQEKDVHWIRPGKEIWANDRFFDIKTYSAQNGIVTFTGLYDEKETALVNSLQNNQEQNSTADNELLAQLFELLQDIYSGHQHDTLSGIAYKRQLFLTETSPLSTAFLSIATPPPQV